MRKKSAVRRNMAGRGGRTTKGGRIVKTQNVTTTNVRLTRKQQVINENATTRSSYAGTGGSPLKWLKNMNELDKPLSKECSVRYINEVSKKGKRKGVAKKQSGSKKLNSVSTNEEESLLPPSTRKTYKMSGEKPLKWLKNITEVQRPLTKVGSVRYIKEMKPSDEESPDDQNEEELDTSTRSTRKSSNKRCIKEITPNDDESLGDQNEEELDTSTRSTRKSGNKRYIKEITPNDDESPDQNEEELDTSTRSTRKRGNKRYIKEITPNDDESPDDQNEEELDTSTRSTMKSGNKRYIKEITPNDDEASEDQNEEELDTSTRPRPTRNSSNKVKKILVQKTPTVKRGKKRTLDASDEVDAGNDVGSVSTRNKYKMSGGQSLKWIRSIAENDKPLTKVGSLRYVKEIKDQNQFIDEGRTTRSKVSENSDKVSSSCIKKSSPLPKTNNRNVTFIDKDMSECSDDSDMQTEDGGNLKSQLRNKNRKTNKEKAIKSLEDKPITRRTSSRVNNAIATRKQYQQVGGTPLKWIRDLNESNKPLTKEGSLRYEAEKVRHKKWIKKTKKVSKSKQTRARPTQKTVTLNNVEEPTTAGSPATRNRYQQSGGKPLKWIRNIAETGQPLSKVGSVRYEKEVATLNPKPLANLRSVNKTKNINKTTGNKSKGKQTKPYTKQIVVDEENMVEYNESEDEIDEPINEENTVTDDPDSEEGNTDSEPMSSLKSNEREESDEQVEEYDDSDIDNDSDLETENLPQNPINKNDTKITNALICYEEETSETEGNNNPQNTVDGKEEKQANDSHSCSVQCEEFQISVQKSSSTSSNDTRVPSVEYGNSNYSSLRRSSTKDINTVNVISYPNSINNDLNHKVEPEISSGETSLRDEASSSIEKETRKEPTAPKSQVQIDTDKSKNKNYKIVISDEFSDDIETIDQQTIIEEPLCIARLSSRSRSNSTNTSVPTSSNTSAPTSSNTSAPIPICPEFSVDNIQLQNSTGLLSQNEVQLWDNSYMQLQQEATTKPIDKSQSFSNTKEKPEVTHATTASSAENKDLNNEEKKETSSEVIIPRHPIIKM